VLAYNQITPKTYIIYEDEPWEVVSSEVSRKQANKPVNRTKIKNLISGRVIEHTFHASDKVKEAEIQSRPIQYIYNNHGEYWFHEEDAPAKRFSLPKDVIGDKVKFLKENTRINALMFTNKEGEEKVIDIKVPIKVELKVTEAPPSIKGDTVSGGNKQVTLETGAVINTPLFINEGDVVVVNTETEQYVSRGEK